MRYPFSLSRRDSKVSPRPILCIQRWDPQKRSYQTAKSAAVLREKLGLDPAVYSPFQKGGGGLIAEAWLKAEPLGQEPKTYQTLEEYLLQFWDWQKSDYIAGKLARKPGSIGKAHVANNLSWVKRYAVPLVGDRPLHEVTTN